MKDNADETTIDAFDERPHFKFFVYKFCHIKKSDKYVLMVYEAHTTGGLRASELVGDNFDNGGYDAPLLECDANFTHFKYQDNPQTRERDKVKFISRHEISQQAYKTWEDVRAITAKFSD